MAPDLETKASTEQSEGSSSSARPGRGRRSGRGRRGGRGRGRQQRQPLQALPSGEPSAQSSSPISERPPVEQEAHAPYVEEPSRAHSEPALQKAIEEVNGIVETLRESLEDMEEVLETLELVERQKNADEQEVERLRGSLRQLRRPREDVPRS